MTETDMTLKFSITPVTEKDLEKEYTSKCWKAKTSVFDVIGYGNTFREAGKDLLDKLREKFSEGNMKLASGEAHLSGELTGATGVITLCAPTNRTLDEFCGMDEAERVEKFEQLVKEEAQEPDADKDEEEEEPELTTEDLAKLPCMHCANYGGYDWKESRILCNGRGSLPPEFVEDCDKVEPANDAEEPAEEPNYYGISIDRETNAYFDPDTDSLIYNSWAEVKPGDIVYIYLKKDKQTAGGFIGYATVESARIDEVTPGSVTTPYKMNKYSEFCNGQKHLILKLKDCIDFSQHPIPVPENQTAPRGINWINPAYVAALEKAFAGDK